MKKDSARLDKGKVYHGDKELYVLIEKALCEKLFTDDVELEELHWRDKQIARMRLNVVIKKYQ